MSSKLILENLVNEYRNQELGPEEFENTVKHYAQTYCQEKLQPIIKILESASHNSSQAAKKYSDDSTSQLAFEIGHLTGYLNQVIYELSNLNE